MRKVKEAFGDGFKIVILSHETDRFLRNDENKTELFEFLAHCIAQLSNAEYTERNN